MSSESTTQVLPSSVDAHGLSVSTATRAAGDPAQNGAAYDLFGLAAAVPLWFHPRTDGAFQAVVRTYWVAATASGGPQSYSAYTDAAASAFFRLDPASGVRGAVFPLPSGFSQPGLAVAATSRAQYLWVLRAGGVLQLFSESPAGMLLQSEEQLPVAGAVGVQVAGPMLRVYYAVAGEVHFIAKAWGQAGIGSQPWSYMGGYGLSPSPADAAPLASSSGTLSSAGPVSAALVRGRTWLTTVESSGGAYTAAAWSSRGLHDPWRRSPLSVPLGSSSTWCGAGVCLQPQLAPNPDQVSALPASAAVPWVKSVKVSSSGVSGIDTSWGLLSVDR